MPTKCAIGASTRTWRRSDQKGKRALCWRTNRGRTTTTRAGASQTTAAGPFLRHCPGSSLLFPNQSTAAPGANYLPTLQDALAGRTILQVDQAASANQAFLRKLDERSQNSDLDRGERLRAGGDLEEGASTTAKFTQYFTNFKREHV